MKQQLNDDMLESVNGGTVYLSRDYMKIGFSTLGQTFDLKGCTYYEALSVIDDLFVNNPGKTDNEFDKLVRKTFRAKGWI